VLVKVTPLNNIHKQLGAKLINFGGWEMPVQYEGIIAEHQNVRKSVGIFDVSHMGEIIIKGPKAKETVQNLVTNDISNIIPGKAIYSPMCYDNGGTVDDLLIYPFAPDEFYLVVNAANTDKDHEWIKAHADEGSTVTNISNETAQVAVQGPKSADTINKIANIDVNTIGFFCFNQNARIGETKVIISRTGYTGEDGFEIYAPSKNIEMIWDMIMEAGREFNIKPIGLGARDTLRFEAGLPLYGHELSPEITPIEAGLAKFVKVEKNRFIGKKALLEQHLKGPERLLVGFEMEQRGIARHSHPILVDGKKIGFVTSGNYSPSLRKNLGMGLIKTTFSKEGEQIQILIRDKPVNARVIKKPFYSRKLKQRYPL
jgi:aminomethyltransferase